MYSPSSHRRNARSFLPALPSIIFLFLFVLLPAIPHISASLSLPLTSILTVGVSADGSKTAPTWATSTGVVTPTTTTTTTTTAAHYGTKPGHFETSIIHFPTSEGVSEVSERANE